LLLDAAMAVFSEHGFAGARVDEIAARAGVNKALLYAYYGDKEGLYRAVLSSRLAPPVSFSLANDADPRRALADVIRQLFRVLLEDPAFARLLGWHLLSAGRNGNEALFESARPFLDAIYDLVKRARASGALRADVDPELFRTAVVALVVGYSIQYSAMEVARGRSGTRRTDEEFLDYACRLLMESGGADAGSSRRRRRTR
jgi:TetR/AcrR family transcriptional regulator